GAPDRAFRPAFRTWPLDLPADHGDLRRLDLGQQPARSGWARRGGAPHPAPAGRGTEVTFVHATSVALKTGARWHAVLLRGPSGAGKDVSPLRLSRSAAHS